MAVIADIADAVVTELNSPGAPGFSQAFTAARAYLPRYELAEMDELHVTVVPKGVEIDVSSRSLAQHDYSIDIAVQQRLTSSDVSESELDGLMGLVEEVADFFRQRRLTQLPQAIWVKTANVPIYAPDHLDQLRQFTSVLTLTFRVLR